MLAVPLARSVRNMLVWFRPETIQTVSWGGDPADKPMTAGPHGPRLTPRRSFELFVESVRARSLPWTSAEVSASQRLRMLVMELVVNRAEQLAVLNDDLRRSNEELDAFAYIASHDLKEPLRGIHKYAHQLLALASGEPEQQRRLEGLVRLTLRMDGLLDSLLHFSRVGRVVLELEETDLGDVLGEALEMVDARRRESRNDIRVARPLPTVRCDRMRVREVFVNLLSNAIKYNDKPVGRIEVSFLHPHEAQAQSWWTEELRGQRVYYVRDNGIGIAPQHIEQIFKMFKRLHGREEFGGGAGAGLAIVRKLVQRHGGEIWVESQPGEGSTFFFTIPSDEGTRHATS
jgi:two-component system, chemotaxis family, sensor kinase Cph1